MSVKTVAVTSLSVAAFVAGAYALSTLTATDDERPRSASFSCWWAPNNAEATVSWTFGSVRSGMKTVTGASVNAPFVRRASGMRRGEFVHVGLSWPGPLTTATGQSWRCKIKAGATEQDFGDRSHRPALISLEVA